MNKHDPDSAPLLPPTLAKHFEDILQRLLTGENPDLHEKNLSTLFEAIATNLFASHPQFANCYFDGLTNETCNITQPRTIDVQGEMWIGRNRDQWTEPFKARIVDKRTTNQGISITLWIADAKAQGTI